MLSERTYSGEAGDLRVAADVVERAGQGGGPAALPGELAALGEALRAVGRACERATGSLVPAARPLDRGIASRYQRAAESWPVLPPPSHERFAVALARLREAADAARLAARRCDQARAAVDALLPSRTGS